MSCAPRQVSIESWTGYQPIALIRLEPEELARRFDLRFVRAHDDLDETLSAAVEARSGRRFALLRHVHAPMGGTEVLCDVRGDDLAEALVEVLEALRLTPSDIEWVPKARATPG